MCSSILVRPQFDTTPSTPADHCNSTLFSGMRPPTPTITFEEETRSTNDAAIVVTRVPKGAGRATGNMNCGDSSINVQAALTIIRESKRDSNCISAIAILNSSKAKAAQSKPNDGAMMHHTGIIFVSPSGSDANDGLSWSAAKKTIYAALEALPGGAINPATAGQGLIYVADGSDANPKLNAGIWLLGNTSDPNYNQPPSGWLRVSGPLRIQGVNCFHANANQSGAPGCYVKAGGGTDNRHPAIWLSGSAATMRFENLSFAYPGVGIRIGINSNGIRTAGGGAVQNVTFENVSVALNQIVGNGPAVDIGDQCFNIWFNRSTFSGNAAGGQALVATSGGLVRSSDVVTVTTKIPHEFSTGDNVGIMSPADLSFQGSFRNITVTGARTFTYAQKGADARSGGGVAFDDRGIVLVEDPGTGGLGSGLIFFQNAVVNGGIRWWVGTNGGGIYIDHVYTEGNYTNALSPILWIGGMAQLQTFFMVAQATLADQCCQLPALIVQNDDTNVLPDQVIVLGGSGAQDFIANGPGMQIGQYNPSQLRLNFLTNQPGIRNGHLYAQTDAGRSSPQNIRYPNLAHTTNTSWTAQSEVFIKNDVADRDGRMNAAQASTNKGGQSWINLGPPKGVPVTTAVGDIFICGVWVRSLAPAKDQFFGGGYSGSATSPLGCGLDGATYTNAYSNAVHGAAASGDGEWEWVWHIIKIGSQSARSSRFSEWVYLDATHPIQVYSPVMLYIPSGSISDNEAFALAYNLRGYSNTCSTGMLCDTVGQVPYVDQSQTWTANQSFASMTLNNEKISSSPRVEYSVFLPGTLTTPWAAGTWTPDRDIKVTRVQAQAKTAPAGCSTSAVIRITDGKNTVSLKISASDNDSGAIEEAFFASTPLTVGIQTAAIGCTVAPADVNVVIQYKMQ